MIDNLVQGNAIGTDITGTVALENKPGNSVAVTANNTLANNSTGGLTTAAGVFYGFGTAPVALTLRGDLSGPPHQQTSGDSTAVYRIVLGEGSRLLASVHPDGFTARLMILDSQGRVLVQSDGLSSSDADAVIDQNLASGNYSLVVETTGGAGAYALTTTLSPTSAPFQPIPVGSDPDAIVAGDFTGDGRTDLAVANSGDDTVSVLLGNGDGTFQPQVTYAVGAGPDRHRGGRLHRRRPDRPGRRQLGTDNDVSVLLGNGDGTFQPQVTYAVGSDPDALVAGDFTGDGRTDLAVANNGDNDVSVLLGNGDGTFQPQVTYAVGSDPDALVAGDFTGDGRTDLAVANAGSERRVGAAGQRRRHLPAPGDLRGGVRAPTPSWRATSPATAGPTWPSPTTDADDVSVLLGNGDGTFQPQVTYAVGSGPDALVAGDFTGDGRTDLAVANARLDDTVSVLLGNGDGTFQPQVTYAVGSIPDALVAGDFTGDGRTDLAVAELRLVDDVSVLLGNGDGTFQPRSPTRWGPAQTPSWRATSTATAGPTWPSPTQAPERRVGAAGQRRRHLPAPGDLRGGVRPRSPSWRATSTATAGPTWPSRTPAPNACRCCWATATAPSSPR